MPERQERRKILKSLAELEGKLTRLTRGNRVENLREIDFYKALESLERVTH